MNYTYIVIKIHDSQEQAKKNTSEETICTEDSCTTESCKQNLKERFLR